MGSDKGETSKLGVVKFPSLPSIYGVTTFAGDGQICGAVVQGSCLFELAQMTRNAGGAQAGEHSTSGAPVAGFTVGNGMRAQQRKTVEMIPHRLHSDSPALDRMAVLTARAKLPAVNVGMTIGTFNSYVSKDQSAVATGARNRRVERAQGIARVTIVIKLRFCSDWAPAGSGMTGFTNHLQRAMGIAFDGAIPFQGSK